MNAGSNSSLPLGVPQPPGGGGATATPAGSSSSSSGGNSSSLFGDSAPPSSPPRVITTQHDVSYSRSGVYTASQSSVYSSESTTISYTSHSVSAASSSFGSQPSLEAPSSSFSLSHPHQASGSGGSSGFGGDKFSKLQALRARLKKTAPSSAGGSSASGREALPSSSSSAGGVGMSPPAPHSQTEDLTPPLQPHHHLPQDSSFSSSASRSSSLELSTTTTTTTTTTSSSSSGGGALLKTVPSAILSGGAGGMTPPSLPSPPPPLPASSLTSSERRLSKSLPGPGGIPSAPVGGGPAGSRTVFSSSNSTTSSTTPAVPATHLRQAVVQPQRDGRLKPPPLLQTRKSEEIQHASQQGQSAGVTGSLAASHQIASGAGGGGSVLVVGGKVAPVVPPPAPAIRARASAGGALGGRVGMSSVGEQQRHQQAQRQPSLSSDGSSSAAAHSLPPLPSLPPSTSRAPPPPPAASAAPSSSASSAPPPVAAGGSTTAAGTASGAAFSGASSSTSSSGGSSVRHHPVAPGLGSTPLQAEGSSSLLPGQQHTGGPPLTTLASSGAAPAARGGAVKSSGVTKAPNASKAVPAKTSSQPATVNATTNVLVTKVPGGGVQGSARVSSSATAATSSSLGTGSKAPHIPPSTSSATALSKAGASAWGTVPRSLRGGVIGGGGSSSPTAVPTGSSTVQSGGGVVSSSLTVPHPHEGGSGGGSSSKSGTVGGTEADFDAPMSFEELMRRKRGLKKSAEEQQSSRSTVVVVGGVEQQRVQQPSLAVSTPSLQSGASTESLNSPLVPASRQTSQGAAAGGGGAGAITTAATGHRLISGKQSPKVPPPPASLLLLHEQQPRGLSPLDTSSSISTGSAAPAGGVASTSGVLYQKQQASLQRRTQVTGQTKEAGGERRVEGSAAGAPLGSHHQYSTVGVAAEKVLSVRKAGGGEGAAGGAGVSVVCSAFLETEGGDEGGVTRHGDGVRASSTSRSDATVASGDSKVPEVDLQEGAAPGTPAQTLSSSSSAIPTGGGGVSTTPIQPKARPGLPTPKSTAAISTPSTAGLMTGTPQKGQPHSQTYVVSSAQSKASFTAKKVAVASSSHQVVTKSTVTGGVRRTAPVSSVLPGGQHAAATSKAAAGPPAGIGSAAPVPVSPPKGPGAVSLPGTTTKQVAKTASAPFGGTHMAPKQPTGKGAQLHKTGGSSLVRSVAAESTAANVRDHPSVVIGKQGSHVQAGGHLQAEIDRKPASSLPSAHQAGAMRVIVPNQPKTAAATRKTAQPGARMAAVSAGSRASGAVVSSALKNGVLNNFCRKIASQEIVYKPLTTDAWPPLSSFSAAGKPQLCNTLDQFSGHGDQKVKQALLDLEASIGGGEGASSLYGSDTEEILGQFFACAGGEGGASGGESDQSAGDCTPFCSLVYNEIKDTVVSVLETEDVVLDDKKLHASDLRGVQQGIVHLRSWCDRMESVLMGWGSKMEKITGKRPFEFISEGDHEGNHAGNAGRTTDTSSGASGPSSDNAGTSKRLQSQAETLSAVEAGGETDEAMAAGISLSSGAPEQDEG